MKRVFLGSLAALALAGASAGVYFWVTAEGTAEEAPPAQEATPTPTPEATPTPAPTPPALPQPSPQPIPDDWLTYTDADMGVTVRYPPDWVMDSPPVSSLPNVRFYKPLPSPPGMPAEAAPPISALVQVYGCCAPEGFMPYFKPWTCDNPEETDLAGYRTGRCVYAEDNPPPGGFSPYVGAWILYTIHGPGEPLRVEVVFFTSDETGTVILDTWNPEDAEEAERIVQSLQIAP